ncbi:MAG: hypothetical protein Q9182_003546 [Xanthomendoza sp. 2 TL-2023]
MSENEQESRPPAARSPSSIARTFSADLNDAFSVDKKLDGLVQSVEQKYGAPKQAVSSQTQELEALEAKLRETEEKLREKQLSPARKTVNNTGQPQQASGAQPQSNLAASETYVENGQTGRVAGQAPSASTMSYWRPPMPGALPETPGDSRQNSYLGGGQSNP